MSAPTGEGAQLDDVMENRLSPDELEPFDFEFDYDEEA